MNIPHKYIIAVPATDRTATAQLIMLCLARQILESFGKHKVGIVAMTETGGVILATAKNLLDGLKHLSVETAFESRKIDNVTEDPMDGDIHRLLTTALLPEQPVDILVIVTTEATASMIPRIVLWDFLGVRNINPRIDMALYDGEAGYVDCRGKSRNALHPQGYQAWAAQVLLGAS